MDYLFHKETTKIGSLYVEISTKFPFYCGRAHVGCIVVSVTAFFIEIRSNFGLERNLGCISEW